jgi:hypothetical protein
MDGAPSNGCSTTTILARPFIEPDAARAPSTPSHLGSKGSLAFLDWFANPLTLLKPGSWKGVSTDR